jgi:uncharacterized protein YdeI (YjbR/CyaY-like superfamily)
MAQTKMDKDVENVHDKKKVGRWRKKANNREERVSVIKKVRVLKWSQSQGIHK